MEAVGDNALVIAPPTSECPVCKTVCKRHSIRGRKVRDIDLDGQRIVMIRVGVYSCPTCKKHFRLQTGLAEKGKHYSKRALNKSFMAVRDDKTTFTALPNRLSRDFHIEPSKSTCHRWFHERADGIDFAKDFEPEAIKSFSGALAIDEVYDREFCIFFATDPLNNRPISFRICEHGSIGELEIFLKYLKSIGLEPEVFISDGSNIYKDMPLRIWPQVKHQSCIFHVIHNCQEDVLAAIRKFKMTGKNRPVEWELSPPDWWTDSVNRQTSFRRAVYENRYLFTKRTDRLNANERKILDSLCEHNEELQLIRQFNEDLLSLFAKGQTKGQARYKRNVMEHVRDYKNHRSLAISLKRLEGPKFENMITFLDYENLDATNNHVERTNRWFRKRQKTHYRNRTLRTITNMLKADLLGRSGHPGQPVRLVRKGPTLTFEKLTA